MGAKFPSYLRGFINIQMGKWMLKCLGKTPSMHIIMVHQSEIWAPSIIPQIYTKCLLFAKRCMALGDISPEMK